MPPLSHLGGLPGEGGGGGVAPRSFSFPPPGPSPRRSRGASSPQGLSPGRAGPLDGFCPPPGLPRSPARRRGAGVWIAGPAGAAERDEGRFLKLYFSAGSFRVNELTS